MRGSSAFQDLDREHFTLKKFDRDNLRFIEIVRNIYELVGFARSTSVLIGFNTDDFEPVEFARLTSEVSKFPIRRFWGFYGCQCSLPDRSIIKTYRSSKPKEDRRKPKIIMLPKLSRCLNYCGT